MKRASLIILFAFYSGNGVSETFTVNQFADSDGSVCDQFSCSLRAAIIASNTRTGLDEIILPPGVYPIDLDGSDSGPNTGDLDIVDDLTIRGGPSTLDGQDLGRIMDIDDDSSVVILDVTFRGGNSSLSTNGTLNSGALELGGGQLTLRRVTFVDNFANSLGGAIRAFDGAEIFIEDSVFRRNVASDGAAIFTANDTNVTLLRTEFDDNRADNSALGNGAALYISGSQSVARLEGVTFVDNTGTGSGATIWFSGQELVLDHVIANDNESTAGNGGFLLLPGSPQAKSVLITHSQFEGNVAENGGVLALANDDDQVVIDQSSFVSNASSDSGGAIFMTSGGVTITNSTFSANMAEGQGGALYVSSADANVVHGTMANNSADEGPDVYARGTSTVTMGNTLVSSGCDVQGVDLLSSLGGNVEGPGDSCELDQPSDQTGLDTMQLAIQPLAANGGSTQTHQLGATSLARSAGLSMLCSQVYVDQRDAIRAATCDSGAVEADAAADDLIFRDDLEAE